jgi:L-ribulose-5-phosphate 3-epimerase
MISPPTREAAPHRGRIAVCSWSLQPAGAADLVQRVQACGVRAVQLALDPVRDGTMPLAELAPALAGAGIDVVSGMMAMAGEDYSTLESIRRTGGLVPAATWTANLEAAAGNARVAASLGIDLVTFHAGFVPHDRADAQRAVLLQRVREIARTFGEYGVAVALETGQESAGTLLDMLADLNEAGVGVNFDPANMILYGMGDPVQALARLAPHVRQLHIKDALPAPATGDWGAEVRAGTGAVDWDALFRLIRQQLPGVDLVIEREAGTDRVADVRAARGLLEAAGFGAASLAMGPGSGYSPG